MFASKELEREYNRKYYQLNKEKIKNSVKTYRKENREKYLTFSKKYRESEEKKEQIAKSKSAWHKRNKEKCRERNLLWIEKNKEKNTLIKRLCSSKRRKYYKNSEHVSVNDILLIKQKQLNKCYYCGIELAKYDVDHYIPLSKGGVHELSNLVIACVNCNQTKHNKMPDEFIKNKA